MDIPLLPMLPMQAWALKNARYDLTAGFVNWLCLSNGTSDFDVLLRSLREIVNENEQLRAAFVEHDG